MTLLTKKNRVGTEGSERSGGGTIWGRKVTTIHADLVYIHVAVDLSLLEIPDLVFAIPLVPDSHGSARGGVTTVGEIDVEIGFADKNADGKDSSVWNRRLRSQSWTYR